ncbi:MAG: ABC transporter ATP-binding protein [Desulfosarcinaceae bacterium]
MASVAFEKVTKRFGKVEVLHEIDLEIASGEFVVLVGPSGCGKSTTLRLLAGLERITAGLIRVDGEVVNDLPPAQRGLAMVFQSYALYPHMNVYENIAFAMRIAKRPKAEIDRKVRQTAETLQLDALLDRLPKQLSGGQRQRVAIGRAIVQDPKVFLFDEPLSNLDARLRVNTRIEITKLHRQMQATMIYVTHDQVEAMTLADRIAVVNKGNIEQFGTPLTLYHRPRNTFVAGFIGSPAINLLHGEVSDVTDGAVTMTLAGGGSARGRALLSDSALNQPVTVGIRPEALNPATEKTAIISGRVQVVEELGEFHLIYVTTSSGDTVIAKVEGNAAVKADENIHLSAAPEKVHIFDEGGRSLQV